MHGELGEVGLLIFIEIILNLTIHVAISTLISSYLPKTEELTAKHTKKKMEPLKKKACKSRWKRLQYFEFY